MKKLKIKKQPSDCSCQLPFLLFLDKVSIKGNIKNIKKNVYIS